MVGEITKSLEFLTTELFTSMKVLAGKSKRQEDVDKRWTAVLFYKAMGKSNSEISRILHYERTSINHCLNRVKPAIIEKANELCKRFKNVESILTYKQPEKRKEIRLVPDYLHSKVVKEEIEC